MTMKVTVDGKPIGSLGRSKAQIFVEEIDEGLRRATPRALVLYGGRLIGRIKNEVKAFAKNSRGDRGLGGSFKIKIIRDAEPKMEILSSARHALIHEHGGTIDGNPYLTIPISERAKRHRGRTRSFGKLRFLRNPRTGKRLLIDPHRRNPIKVHYLLKKSITLKPRRYLTKATVGSVRDGEKTFGQMAVAVTRTAARKTR